MHCWTDWSSSHQSGGLWGCNLLFLWQGPPSQTSTTCPGAGEKPEPVSSLGPPSVSQSPSWLSSQHHPETGGLWWDWIPCLWNLNRVRGKRKLSEIQGKVVCCQGIKWSVCCFYVLLTLLLSSFPGLITVNAMAGRPGSVQWGLLGCPASAVSLWVPASWCCWWINLRRRRRGGWE